MDVIYDNEIFELWLRAPDLAVEIPWILRHSFENFQETRLMEDEKRPGYAPAPFKPVRKQGTLQDRPLHLEEPDSSSDTLSTPQDCLVDDHNSFVSTPRLGVESARTLHATSKLPLSAIMPLPCNAHTETVTERAKPHRDLPAEHEKTEPVFANSIMLHRDLCSESSCVFISTPSLGVMLEAARIPSYAPSSSHQGSLFDDLNMVRLSSALGGELEEAATGSGAPMSLCQDLPSDDLHMFISTPSLGVKLGRTTKISHAFMSLHQDSPDELRIIRPNSSLEVKLEAVGNIADAQDQLAQYPSSHELHLFLSTPSLGVRLGTTERIPGSLEMSSELGFLSVEEFMTHRDTKDGTKDGEESEIVEEKSEQDSASLVCEESSGVRNVDIPLSNTYLIEEDNSSAQEYKTDLEVSPANSESIGFLQSCPEDTQVSTAHDVTNDAAVSPASFATHQALEISLDDCKDISTCDRSEVPITQEPLLGPDDLEVSPANSESFGFLPCCREDTRVSTAHDVTNDAAVSPASFATHQALGISLDDCKKDITTCDRREVPITPESLLGADDGRQEVFKHPRQPSETSSSQDKVSQANTNNSDREAHLSSSKGRCEEATAHRYARRTLSHLVNAYKSPNEARSSSSSEICDHTPSKDTIPRTPVTNALKPSETSRLANSNEEGNCNQKSQEYLNSSRNCNVRSTERIVSHIPQQPRKANSSPPRRYDGLGGKQWQHPPTEPTRGCAPLARNLTPINQAHNHGTNTASTLADKVHDSCGDLTGPRWPKGPPRGKIKRVPVAPSGGGEKAMKFDSLVKVSSVSASPVTPETVGSGASPTPPHVGGQSRRSTSRPRHASNESLHNRNPATTRLNVSTKLGTGIDIDPGAGTGNKGGAESCGRSSNATPSQPRQPPHPCSEVNAGRAENHPCSEVNADRAENHPCSEVNAERAENHPTPPGASRSNHGKAYLNRPPVNHSSTPQGHGWPQSQRRLQPSYRNYHGPSANSVVQTPATSPIPPIPSSVQLLQSIQAVLNQSTEVVRVQAHDYPRRVRFADCDCDPAPAAAIRDTATMMASTPAPTMSLNASKPVIAAQVGGVPAANPNAPAVALAPHVRRISNSNVYARNQASAMAPTNANPYAPAAGAWRPSQAPYAPHDEEVIRPVGNWDASADDAAQIPIAGGGNFSSRIDLRKVRQYHKLNERFRPRFQGPPPGLTRATPVQTAGVPIYNRPPKNELNDTKSPRPSSPVKEAISEPFNATRSLQAAAKSPEPARQSIPPHLRQTLTPAVPKLPLHQKLPTVTPAQTPMPALNGKSRNSNLPPAKQAQVPIANPQIKSNPAADGASGLSTGSQHKISSDHSLSESVDKPLRSPKGKQTAKVTFQKSTTPPLADSSDRSAKTNGVLIGGVVPKEPDAGPQHPLLGWDGAWQEAPVDWSGRELFDTQDKYRLKAMNTWMEERALEALNNPVTVDTKVPGFETGEALAVGGEKLQKPLDRRIHDTRLPDDDFTHAKKDGTALDALEKHQARIRVTERETRAAERDAKADRRAYRESVREAAAKFVPRPNPHTPRANIYIRPAILEDMSKIAELYNHYIVHSVVASERTPMNAHQWQTRWEDAREAKYAFLVAVQASPRGGGYSRRTSEEVLTGFAYADDYGDRNGAWRFTCEIQFFVAHWQLRAGVGKSLVDRMLLALDPIYVPRNGVQFAGCENSIQYEQGGERVVSKIMVGIPFAAKEDADVKWQKEWLAQFEFEEVAIFPKIGRKLGKEISVMWLHKETGSILSNGM